ncbi:CpsB/CapC family capsule biosynthesis tyrosine phosphatase [Flavihumibacter sp. CACIAM 22H1]|uniref:tyrosine-protein phosphatase n=1 Tax=Flavihumibacter sp. CACIAM 22H1 TaxID=1812911 RepID=UPI000B25E0A9|nr:CpsB/CapC family capsule biosynthesis tyrosine phosphatase [Flavihumibacter sp. CACIAM 22H1]
MHSHLLPGIDDGAPDAATSLQLLTGLQDLGIQGFITTPHILWDLYKNTAATIEPAQQLLQAELDLTNNPVLLEAAAEYLIDDYFSRLLQEKAPLRVLRNNHVLVEFSFVSMPYDWKKVFFDLQIQGYQPVLAHPERYTYLFNKWPLLEEFREMGILLQVNLNSLTGYYGKPMQQQAQQLIKRQMVSFLGSDLHHQRHLDALRQSSTLMPLVKDCLNNTAWKGFGK